jgi:hypothetical protein
MTGEPTNELIERPRKAWATGFRDEPLIGDVRVVLASDYEALAARVTELEEALVDPRIIYAEIVRLLETDQFGAALESARAALAAAGEGGAVPAKEVDQ